MKDNSHQSSSETTAVSGLTSEEAVWLAVLAGQTIPKGANPELVLKARACRTVLRSQSEGIANVTADRAGLTKIKARLRAEGHLKARTLQNQVVPPPPRPKEAKVKATTLTWSWQTVPLALVTVCLVAVVTLRSMWSPSDSKTPSSVSSPEDGNIEPKSDSAIELSIYDPNPLQRITELKQQLAELGIKSTTAMEKTGPNLYIPPNAEKALSSPAAREKYRDWLKQNKIYPVPGRALKLTVLQLTVAGPVITIPRFNPLPLQEVEEIKQSFESLVKQVEVLPQANGSIWVEVHLPATQPFSQELLQQLDEDNVEIDDLNKLTNRSIRFVVSVP